MSEEKSSQSINFSGGQFSNTQIGQAGRDLAQSQQFNQGATEKPLTPEDVVKLLTKFEELLRGADLPESQKEKAIKHLDTTREEVQQAEPDKDFAAKSLQRATKVLKDADEAVGAGQGLWQKVGPIITQLAPWFGLAAKTILPL